MEIHDPNLHLKLIEMCDCYLETDYQTQIQRLAANENGDPQETAITYLALAIMYSLTQKAEKLTFKRKNSDLSVTVKADGEKSGLRAPTRPVFDQIIATLRTILHIEEDKGALPLELGLRSGDIELQVKVERKADKESLKLKFPTSA